MQPPKTRRQMRQAVINRLLELHSILEVMLYDLDEVLNRVQAEERTSNWIADQQEK